jgi:hypothetical protein
MEPASTEPRTKKDSAVIGILAGLGIGLAAAVASVFLFFAAWGSHGIVVAIPFLLPPASVVVFGIIAHRNNRPRFGAGLLIAAAVVMLLEAACATRM